MNAAGFKFPAANGTSTSTSNGTSPPAATAAATITTKLNATSAPKLPSPSSITSNPPPKSASNASPPSASPAAPQSYLPLLTSLKTLSAAQKTSQIALIVSDISTTIVEISKLIESGTLPSSSIAPLKSFLATIQFPDRQRNAELDAKLKAVEAELETLREQRKGDVEIGSVNAKMVGAMQELRIEMLKAKAETESVRREFETVKGHLEGLKLEREAFVTRIKELEELVGKGK